jgi:hypothetical protein
MHAFRTRRASRVAVAFLILAAGVVAAQVPAAPQATSQGLWYPVGRLTVPRFLHTATLMRDGQVLVAGGRTSTAPLASAEIINPFTLRSFPTGSMSEVRWRHTATTLLDGRVLVAGGFAGAPGPNAQPVLNTAEIYDPATRSWTPTGTMTERRALHSAALLPDGRVLVAGGRSCRFAPPFACNFEIRTRTAEVWDPATGIWTRVGDMHETRHTTEAARLPDGTVLVPAGFGNDGEPSRTADRFNPATGVWTLTGFLTQGRSRQGAVPLPDGDVLVTAGFPQRATSEQIGRAHV